MATTTAWVMAKRVLISALVGVLTGAALVDPVITVLYQHFEIHNDYWFDIGLLNAAGILLVRAPGIAILGAIVASPLVAIAVTVGVLFRRRIDRHPLLWTSIAPVLVWLFTCAIFALQDNGQSWMPHRSFPQRLLGALRGIDNSLFFFAPAASALCFAALTRRAARLTSKRRP